MRALFPLIACSAFLMCVEYVSETHSNGMPKVIKTYNGYGKLELTKESGYYSDGTKQYEKSYYNGQAKNTITWDRNGKRLTASKNSINQKSDWTDSSILEMMENCVSSTNMNEEQCQCSIDVTISMFTYSEFKKLENISENDPLILEMMPKFIGFNEALLDCAK